MSSTRSGRSFSQQDLIPDSPDERRQKKQQVEAVDRLPPQNLEAERGVVASAMFDPSCVDHLVSLVRPDDFYSDANRHIFIAINNVHAAGRRVDVTLIADRLKRAGVLEEIGGIAYLMEVVDSCCHAGNYRYYADLVKECAMRRRVIYTAQELLRHAFDQRSDIREASVAGETKLGDIGAARDSDSLKLAVDVARERLNRIKAKKEPKRGLKTGIYALDKVFDGYEVGHLNIIAARTSIGKTALATSHVTHWLQNTDLVGYFCSLEMSDQEVVERILCNYASIDMFRLRNHFLEAEEIARLQEAFDEISATNRLYIDHATDRTVSEILAMARRVKRMAKRLDYVIVDYLQLIECEDKYAKRHEAVGKITRALKHGASMLGCPLIVLAQLNREADAAEKPRLSHLRESGSIEQDADKIIFIHRPSSSDEAINSQAELIVAKNRHGKLGDCQVAFFGSYQRFQGLHADVAF